MVIEFEPWHSYPDLKQQYLSILANLIRRVRDECVKLHQPQLGDGDWCLGSRVYQRTYFAITQLANQVDWIAINTEMKHLQFSFSIGNVQLRFFKGDPEDPPTRYLSRTPGEQIARQLCFEFDGIPTADTILRLAVKVDATRRASSISLVEINEYKDVERIYRIPFDVASSITPTNITSMPPTQAPPVNMPPAIAEPLKKEQPAATPKELRINAAAK
jgi:hypothetical protein